MRRRLILGALLVVWPLQAEAVGPVVNQSTCALQATLPTTNTNGSALDDLKEARFYIGTSPTAMPTMPTSTIAVATPQPAPNTLVKASCVTLAPGQYYFDVRIADLASNASAPGRCQGGAAAPCPFVSRDDVPPDGATELQAVGP